MSNKGSRKSEGATNGAEALAGGAHEAAATFVKAGAETYEKAFATAKQRIDEAVRNYDELAAFGKGNVDAVVAAGSAYTRGCEQISAEVMAFGKQSVEESIAAAKALFGARTVQEALDLQTSFAKTWLDAWLSQSSKLGELATKVAQETAEPISSRMSVAVDRFVKTA